jgi:hypothetical protein
VCAHQLMLMCSCTRAPQHNSFAVVVCKASAGNVRAMDWGQQIVQHSLQKQVASCCWPCACEWCCADLPVLFVSWRLRKLTPLFCLAFQESHLCETTAYWDLKRF